MPKKHKLKLYPDRVLRQKAKPVIDLDGDLHNFISRMAKLMYENHGIGLAAPQLGVLQRIVMADIGEGLLTLINPVIIEQEGQDRFEEDCLSLPGIRVQIDRNFTILVQGVDTEGTIKQIELNGMMSRIIQHEIDHLNGVLIIDYASVAEKFFLKEKLEQHRREYFNSLDKINKSQL
jgi:peptide deformylase